MTPDARTRLAEAIADALAEEREACALAVRELCEVIDCACGEPGQPDDLCTRFMAAIRARA